MTTSSAHKPRRPVATYSIVAQHRDTGEMGVAVQSHWFSVGSVVSWAESGVGAVATQSFAEPGYGQRALDLMRSGLSADEALTALLAVDKHRAERQVAVLDCRGGVTAHTGSRCIASASHHVSDRYSVQANMAISDDVVPAMARAFEAADGPLVERLLSTLEAAEAAGGDVRGKQSAALLIVQGLSSGLSWKDRKLDLRVEDHPEPVAELRRLMVLHEAYEHMDVGDQALARGDMQEALAEYSRAIELAPQHIEIQFWHAVTLATNGQFEQARPFFSAVFARGAQWVELVRRLQKPGIIPDTDIGRSLVERILAISEASS